MSRALAYGCNQQVCGIDDSHSKGAIEKSSRIVTEIWNTKIKLKDPTGIKNESLYTLPVSVGVTSIFFL